MKDSSTTQEEELATSRFWVDLRKKQKKQILISAF